MKKLFFVSTIFLAMFLFSCNSETKITKDQLPTNVQSYLTTHFNTQEILSIEKEDEVMDTEYKVIFKDGTELEFDKNGDVEKIESMSGLPESVIPQSINNYVKVNHPTARIVQLEFDDDGYEVELDNGSDLDFDRDGDISHF